MLIKPVELEPKEMTRTHPACVVVVLHVCWLVLMMIWSRLCIFFFSSIRTRGFLILIQAAVFMPLWIPAIFSCVAQAVLAQTQPLSPVTPVRQRAAHARDWDLCRREPEGERQMEILDVITFRTKFSMWMKRRCTCSSLTIAPFNWGSVGCHLVLRPRKYS